MPSDVDIASNALHEIGEKSITSFDDDSDRARLVKRFYDMTRDATLRAHPWNFAVTRRALAQESAAPIFEYDFAYALPTDPYCLRVLRTHWTPGYPWKIEGRLLLTDKDSVSILYVARITDPEKFDTLFTEAFTTRLASKLSIPVTGQTRLALDLFTLSMNKIQEARTVDGQEGTPETVEALFLTEIR